jgi:glycosyltransferase involved in cell wall biosynthesis
MTPRSAIVHDWLVTWRGGENVLAEVLERLPNADLFALVDFLPPAYRRRIGGRHARTSFLQSMPLAARHFRLMLPLFPAAARSLDLAGYDLVVSISHAAAKNVRVRPGQVHLCYCLTPMRYAWDVRATYLDAVPVARGPGRWAAEWLLDRMTSWDRRGAAGVTRFIAISRYIAQRIEAAYGRKASVIYPPVDTDYFVPPQPDVDRTYYLTASRFVAYKRIDAITAAFGRLPGRRLVVVGAGPDERRIRAAAAGSVEFAGEVSRERLRELMQGARAFLFAAEEDFGIVPLEAQACGTPVIALSRGGTAETIQPVGDAPVGVLFDDQTADAIAAAVLRFEALQGDIRAQACRLNAERFSADRFRAEFGGAIEGALAAGRARAVTPVTVD